MELCLIDFEAWCGGKSTLDYIIENGGTEAVEALENALCELYPDGLTETALNDILWFDDEWCLEVAGVKEVDEDEDF